MCSNVYVDGTVCLRLAYLCVYVIEWSPLNLLCCVADVHSLIYYAVGSEGLSLPTYTERVTLNGVTVFYYDSTMMSTAPCPEWLNTTSGKQLWKESSFSSYTNRATMALSLEMAKSQFNNTGRKKSFARSTPDTCF